jgi:MFS family permease
MFITNAFNTCYSSIANLFFIYWFQDEVGGCVSGDVATNLGAGSGSANSCVPEFTLLGHFISSSPRTALALTTTISTVCSFVLVLPGGWIADRFVEDRALVMLVGALLQTSAPLINAFMPTFTWVCFACIITGVLNGLTGSASKAILADCVPLDPHTGKPFAPARDYIMMSYSSVVPTLILPGILGVVFDSFSSPSLAYKSFFLAASALHLCSSFLYLKVKRTQVAAKAARQSPGAAAASVNGPPVGARLCDALLFGHSAKTSDAHSRLLQ